MPLPSTSVAFNSSIGFGFFPNRNQTANVLALAGIVLTALGFEMLSRRPACGLRIVREPRADRRGPGLRLLAGGHRDLLRRDRGEGRLVAAFFGFAKGTTLGFAAVLALLTHE